jgi:uracil phosphoribosyltransferase
VYEISQYLLYEATRDVATKTVRVPTPLVTCDCQELADRVGIVPVLRAGLGMAAAMLDVLPEATVWHIGVARDHETLRPKTYYRNLPTPGKVDVAVVLDPMLATGGSAIETIELLKSAGMTRIKFVGLIAAPEGVAKLQQAHPDVPIFLAAVDEKLNEVGYILPGLGDAGDRQFGTA